MTTLAAILLQSLLLTAAAGRTIEVFLIEAADVTTQRAKTRQHTDLTGKTSTGDGWRASVAAKAEPLAITGGPHAGKFAINSDFGLSRQNPSPETIAFRTSVLLEETRPGVKKYPLATVQTTDINRDPGTWQQL